MNQQTTPSYEAIAHARLNPNSWIYQIDGRFAPDEAVPPQAIAGAWRVDHAGKIVGSFIPNPHHATAADAGDAGMPIQLPWSHQ
jgi:hypothetical protein